MDAIITRYTEYFIWVPRMLIISFLLLNICHNTPRLMML